MKENKYSNKTRIEDRALDRFADMMISKIGEMREQGWEKPWFTDGQLGWPKNLSGREYNSMNAFMLLMHCEENGYKVPVFATFERISSLNYHLDKQGKRHQVLNDLGEPLPSVSVNKGEKSFPVFLTTFTVIDKETKEHIKYEDYKQLSEKEKEKYNVYPKRHVYNVFNVLGQTNIQESRPELYEKLLTPYQSPKLKDGDMFRLESLDKMIEHQSWICPIHLKYGDSAYYSISKEEIVLPERQQFTSGESFCGTFFHEAAHSTGAAEYLNRFKEGEHFGSTEYAKEELIAEMSAALVCQRYGITKYIKDDSVPYMKSWLTDLKKDSSFIKTVLDDVKRASSIIIEHLEKENLVQKKDENLDIQKESDSQLVIDDSGEVELSSNEHLKANKKQGEDESSATSEDLSNRVHPHRMHR